MAKQVAKDTEVVSVIRVFKDPNQGDSVYARAFGYEEIQIPLSVLEKEGKVISQNVPDLFDIFMTGIERWCRKYLGL